MKYSLLHQILNIGTDAAKDADQKNNVIITNKISLLLSLLPLIYITSNVIINGWARITLPIIAQPLLFLIPILVNYFGFTTASRVIVSWIMTLQAMTYSIYNKYHGFDHQTAHYIGILFSILASTVIPFLVFRLKERTSIVLSLMLPILTMVLFDQVHALFGVSYYQVGLHESGYALTPMRVSIGCILILGSTLFLKQAVERNEQANRNLISNLGEKNNEVLTQLEEITAQNEYISHQKSQLESQKDIIQEQNSQLQTAKTDLEKRVQERTRDLSNANLELDKKNTQLENFAFMAAHNLRSPIARIQGLISLINLPATDSNEKDKILSLISKSAEDLDEVIKDLVTIVQLGHQPVVETRKLKLTELVNGVVKHLHIVAEHPEVKILNDVAPDFELEANESYATSVLASVLNNSIKYKGLESSIISIHAFKKSSYSVVEVIDNGIGFDAETNREKIFKPFSRLNDKYPGKGLGLYLVKMQMESMGGQVSIESEKGKGTVLKLMFPESMRSEN